LKLVLGTSISVIAGALLAMSTQAQAQDCIVPPTYINGYLSEVEGEMTVKAGKGCRFGLNGIEGAITEAVIIQKPKVGMAGVQGLRPYYIAKPGYHGPDEFSYGFIGTGRHGGPMRVVFKRKVTVVP
jgi:hypothetical protein